MPMTWADIVANGGGDVEFRLVIEGCKYEFVTSPAMAGDCTETGQTGKKRVFGLARDSVGFSESVHIAGAEIDVQIEGIRIYETPEGNAFDAASEAFSAIPNREIVAQLAANLASGTGNTTLTVDSNAQISVGDRLHMGVECMHVTAKPTSTTCTVARGQWRTVAVAHSVDSLDHQIIQSLSRVPWRYKNRRCWLYAHTSDELAVASTGTIVWRGVVGAEPRLDDAGVEWSFPVDSRWSMLSGKIASDDIGEIAIRGVYRSWYSPFFVRINRSAGTSVDGPWTAGPKIAVVGFWETEDEYLAAIIAALNGNADVISWGISFSIERSPTDHRWELAITMPSSGHRYYEITGGSVLDGSFIGYLSAASTGTALNEDPASGPRVLDVVASTTYLVRWTETSPLMRQGSETIGADKKAARGFPSTAVHQTHFDRDAYVGTMSLQATYPNNRIYVNSISAIESIGSLRINGRDYTVTAASATYGYVEIGLPAYVGPASPHAITASGSVQPEIEALAVYGGLDGVSLAGFMSALTTAAVNQVTKGTCPFITGDDVAEWSSVVNVASQGDPRLLYRRYAYSKSVSVDEIVREECKLLGVFPYLDADFKIALRRITLEASTSSAVAQVDDTMRVASGSLPYGSIDFDVDGSVNVMRFQRFYDAREDAHSKSAYVEVASQPAIGQASGVRSVLEVAPKSTAVTGEIERSFCVMRSMPLLHLFSSRLMEVRIEVSLKALNVRCGDTVLVSVAQLPFRGGRAVHGAVGMTSARGIVVGREWQLGSNAHGTLRVIISGSVIAGYSPTAQVLSGVNTSGDLWDLYCVATVFARAGIKDCSLFAVGYRCRVYRYDNGSPQSYWCQVTAVNTTTDVISVLMEPGFPGFTGYWLIGFDDTTNVASTSAQQDYAAIADATENMIETEDQALRADFFAP